MFLQIILHVAFGLLFGSLCSNLAGKRGKNTLLWFQLGFFFGIFALIFFYILQWKNTWRKAPKFAEETSSVNSQLQKDCNENEAVDTPRTTTLNKREWFYLDASAKQIGPISYDALKEKIISNEIIEDKSFLWSVGMENWKTLSDLPYLNMVLKSEITSSL